MTTYIVTLMTQENYDKYMEGYNDCGGSYLVNVRASNKEEARNIATRVFCGKVVMRIRTEEEAQAEEEARAKAIEENAKRDANRKAKREANDARKAEEAGMSVKEYKALKAREAKVRKYRKEIEELKAEIAKREAYIEAVERG